MPRVTFSAISTAAGLHQVAGVPLGTGQQIEMLSALLHCGVWGVARELFQVVLQGFSEVAVVVRLNSFGAVPRTAVAHRSCRHPPVSAPSGRCEGRGVNPPSAMPLN